MSITNYVKDSVKKKLLSVEVNSMADKLNKTCFRYSTDFRYKLNYLLYLSEAYRLIKDCKKLIDTKTDQNDTAIAEWIGKIRYINKQLEKFWNLIEKKNHFIDNNSLEELIDILKSLNSNNTPDSAKSVLAKFYKKENGQILKNVATGLKSHKEYLVKNLIDEFKKITTILRKYKDEPKSSDDNGAMYLHKIYEETDNVIRKLPNSLLKNGTNKMSIKKLRQNLTEVTQNLRDAISAAVEFGNIEDVETKEESNISLFTCNYKKLPHALKDVGIGIELFIGLQ